MQSKTKDTNTFFSLGHRRKHRVRKGLAEVLGAFGGHHGESAELENHKTSQPPPRRSLDSSSGAPSLRSQPSNPLITISSAVENHFKKPSHRSTEPNMAILDSFRKSRPHSTRAITAPIPRQDTGSLAVPKKLPTPSVRVESDRMSVISNPATFVSDTTSIEEVEREPKRAQIQRSRSQTRNITPPTPKPSYTPQDRIMIVQDVYPGLEAKFREEVKGSKNEWLGNGLTIESFLEYIGGERLRRMPPKGSRWDKILKWAEYFASSLSFFQESVDGFMSFSKEATALVLGCLRVLLQMGPAQGVAMERVFSIFNQFGLAFAFYLRNYTLLSSMFESRQEMSFAMADTLSFAVEVTVYYCKSIRTMSTSSVTIDFNVLFGRSMDSFVSHKDKITNLMWTYQLRNSKEIANLHVSIEDIRQWLLPQDTVLQTMTVGRRGTRNVRAEFTCEWFERPLVEFIRSKDQVLTISGETGAGKSILSGWIIERLQRPIGRKVYQTIECRISNQIPAQGTQVGLVKALLLQLLDQNVGNVTLYRCLANVLELDSNTANPEDAEDALWYVLNTALEPCKDVVLVVDGLDALQGVEAKQLKAFEKLYEVAIKHKNVRVVVLTKPFSVPFPKPSRQFTIDNKRTAVDVKHITRSYLFSRGLTNEREVEEFSEAVALRSGGSLTWADMTMQLLLKEKDIPSMANALKQIPSTTKEVIDYHLSLIPLKGEARFIISWMLVAKRPLRVIEVQNLLELNITKGTYRPRSTNITDDIQKACGSLVTVQDKTVYFRNESIRLHLMEVGKEGKQLLSPTEANRDMTTRLLLYNKVCVTRNTEPSMEVLSQDQVQNLFRANSLLEYSVRNWASHFRRSTFFVNGQLQPLTPEFKNAFPNSTLLALLERSCWEKQTLMSNANQSHVLALTIRKAALGDQHRCVLQSSINVAKSYEKLSSPTAASQYYAQASRLGQAVLGKTNDISVSCAVASVESTANLKETARTDEVTRKEEMIKYIVESDKQLNGPSSTLASKFNNMLAQLYTDIKENDKAENVYREIYKTSTEQHGEFSGEAATAAEKLSTVLYKGSKHEDVVKYQQPLFESAEKNLEIFDIRRVEITLRMAKSYEQSGEAVSAEELYISLWRGLTEYCRTHSESSEAHERKIQVTISYAKFLKGQGRQAEAENILHGTWLDYQHRPNKSESLVGQLKLIGEELTAMGVLETAITVFKSICGWFKGSGKQASPEAVSAATSLLNTVQKKSDVKKEERAKIAAASGKAVVEDEAEERDDEAETIMGEVVEAVTAAVAAKAVASAVSGDSAPATAEAPQIGQTTLQACESLSVSYMNRHRWLEATNVCQKMLKQLWPTIGQEDQVGFPKVHTAESIKFARRLALCYVECNQAEQAEKIYTQLFLSARSGLRIQDTLVAETANELISLYERTKQYNKALAIYQQLLESYRTGLGARNALTVQTLYTIGDFCTKYHLKGADRYYLEITNASKDDSGIIGKDSMRAALTLSKIYYEQKRWEEARSVYASLWTTFTQRAKEYNLSTEVVQNIYGRYTTVLTTYLKAPTETVRQVAVEYRDTCQEVYGADSEIAISSNLQLVEVCKDSPEHQEEAIKISEQVIAKMSVETPDKPKSAGQLEILAKAKRHLASLYSTATTASAESTANAVALWKEQLESNKKELGVSHKASLASLAALVGIHAKSEEVEVQAAAKEHLQTAVVEVLTTEKDSAKLLEAAVSLAKMYTSAKLTNTAWAVLKDLRYQVISKEARATGKFTVKLPETVDRRSFVFVAAFEETLRNEQQAVVVAGGKTEQKSEVSFSDVMTDLLTESILFDRYNLSLRSKDVSVQLKLFDGARLYAFLKADKQHEEQRINVENALFDLFMKNVGTSIKTSPEATRVFFVSLLENLGKQQRNEDIVVVGYYSGTDLVYSLLEAEKFALAYEVATCVFQFIVSTQGFTKPKNMAASFKLSLYLAGLGVKKPTDAELSGKMVELSKVVLRETLAACKTLEIDLVTLQASELNNLVRLMGEQKNYSDLEWLLTQLWNSRQLQASWSATTIISVGRRLVEVRFVRNQVSGAIALCESMCYNLRRTWGLLDKVTIDLLNLLSSLYVAAGRYSDAMAIHEEILRTEVSGDPDELMNEDIASQEALKQLELMKRIYGRQSGWGPDESEDYSELVGQVIDEFGEDPVWTGVEGVETWSTRTPPESDILGTFIAPNKWEFVDVQESKKLDYLPRWLRLNRQLSFGDLAFQADKDKEKN